MTSAANSPKTPTRKPRSTILAVLVTAFGLLLAFGVVVLLAGYFWPGFFRAPAPPPARIDDPLALLPAGSNWVIGADLDTLRGNGTLEPILDFLTNPPVGAVSSAFPAGMAEVVRDGQSVLVAGAAGDEKAKPVVILTTRGSADMEKIKRECRASAEQTMHGFTVYRTQIGKAEAGKKTSMGWLSFPGDRVVLLSESNEQDFAALLAAARTPVAHPAAASIREVLAQELRPPPLWAVLHFDAPMKQKLREMLPKDMGDVATALQTGRGAILKIEFPEKAAAAHARLEVLHHHEAHAAELAKAAQQAWKDNKPLVQAAVIFMALQNHPATGLVRDLTRTLTIEAHGQRAVATMQVSDKTLQQLEKRPK